MTIAILGAMEEEICGLVSAMSQRELIDRGSRRYHLGRLDGHDVVVTLSRIGKVAAASSATTLLDNFNARMLIFTGVAGAIAAELKVGDVVVANRLIQHDMDASAVMSFKKFEIPLLGETAFIPDEELRNLARTASEEFVASDPAHRGAKVYEGLIASGDQFIAKPEVRAKLAQELPGLMAVEMEGAAVAQVCYEWQIPFVVIRSISDHANDSSPTDFGQFLKKTAAPLSEGVVRAMLERLAPKVAL